MHRLKRGFGNGKLGNGAFGGGSELVSFRPLADLGRQFADRIKLGKAAIWLETDGRWL